MIGNRDQAANLDRIRERIAADLSEVKEGLVAVGLSAVKLRRALRTEMGQKQETAERPLHRSPALRKIFKQAAALASVDSGSLQGKN